MGKGPQESRFDSAVQGMNEFDVLFAASEWRAGQDRLKKVATALRAAAPKMHEDFGGETGATAQVAFEKVGAAADKRAQEMGEVADALDRTHVAMTRRPERAHRDGLPARRAGAVHRHGRQRRRRPAQRAGRQPPAERVRHRDGRPRDAGRSRRPTSSRPPTATRWAP